MGLSVLAEKCRTCPKVDTCNNKRMEALAYMAGPCERELATGTASAEAVQINTASIYEAFFESVEKAVAVAAQIPQHIICKHYGER